MIIFYVPISDENEARRMARALVEERLAACVNFFPMRSVYRWEGELREEPEVAMILKTREELADALAARVAELHPYEVPCILSILPREVNAAYAAWVRESTGGGKP